MSIALGGFFPFSSNGCFFLFLSPPLLFYLHVYVYCSFHFHFFPFLYSAALTSCASFAVGVGKAIPGLFFFFSFDFTSDLT